MAALCPRMIKHLTLSALVAAALSACAVIPPAPAVDTDRRPLDSLPSGAPVAEVEADLLATARDRYGQAALDRALAAPSYLIVKRFAGFVLPPPNAGPDWRAPTPTALLIQENGRWYAATATGWRAANAAAMARIEPIVASPAFRADPTSVPACPDFGASNLLARLPGVARTVRSHQCDSPTARIVDAALEA
jgi:hypothetical protein